MIRSEQTLIHGHRGCRGSFPANTIPAFLRAAEVGCHWLEMDVVITADGRVLVSHEPWMDYQTCKGPGGLRLTEEVGRALNIFRMPLAEVQQYQAVAPAGGILAYKPLLAEVVAAIEAFSASRKRPAPQFNIEVKSEAEWYGTYQPDPEEFTALVIAEVERCGLVGRCLLQSFDPAILQAAHRFAPSIPLALLVDNKLGMEANLSRLSFPPRYFSSAFEQVDSTLVSALHHRGIGVLAWTVNREADLLRMLELGVDGLITDDPAKALALAGY